LGNATWKILAYLNYINNIKYKNLSNINVLGIIKYYIIIIKKKYLSNIFVFGLKEYIFQKQHKISKSIKYF